MESEKIAGAAGGRKITGHISQIIGPVVDVAFEGPENEIVLPSIHDAMDIRCDDGRTLIVEVQQHIGEEYGSYRGDGQYRRVAPRYGGRLVFPADHDARGRADQGPPDERRGRGDRRHEAARRKGRLPHSPRAAEVRRTDDGAGGALHRNQGDRPVGAVLQGRKDRPVRRGGRRQDRADHGADQQHRQKTPRLFGVRGRRRTYSRGQRPVARDARVGRHPLRRGFQRKHGERRVGLVEGRLRRGREIAGDARVRPNERASPEPELGGSVGADGGRIVPRCRYGDQGHSVLYR